MWGHRSCMGNIKYNNYLVFAVILFNINNAYKIETLQNITVLLFLFIPLVELLHTDFVFNTNRFYLMKTLQ